MSKPRSGGGGGGPAMNKNVKVGVKSGGPSKATSPAAADGIGQTVAFTKERVDGGGRGSRSTVPLGNAKALDIGKGGVGTGRTLYGQCGSQGHHGPVAGTPRPPSRDILSDYGPESKRKG